MFEFTQSPLLLLVQPGARLRGVHLFYACHFIRLITHTHARTQAHVQTPSTWLRGEPVLYVILYVSIHTHTRACAHTVTRTNTQHLTSQFTTILMALLIQCRPLLIALLTQTHSTWLGGLRLFCECHLKPVEYICHFIRFNTNTRTRAKQHKHTNTDTNTFLYINDYMCVSMCKYEICVVNTYIWGGYD